jgi:hypothetical protein
MQSMKPCGRSASYGDVPISCGTMTHQFGTPRFSEWDGLWKQSISEADVTGAEYEEVSSELDGCLRRMFRSGPTYVRDFYVRGDFTGDRTQIIEINDPRILTQAFLTRLQGWLVSSGHSNWRILIPTYLTKNEMIVVYASSIRISAEREKSLAEALQSIADRMTSYVRKPNGS